MHPTPESTHRRDRRLIYGAALLRGFAAGAISVLAAVYLAKRGFPADDIGVVLSAGMAGVFAGTAYGTFLADRVGRRRSLVLLALLAAAGGAALAWFDSLPAVAAAAFVGMLSTQGSDRGAAQALEVSILPSTTSDAERTRVTPGTTRSPTLVVPPAHCWPRCRPCCGLSSS